MSERTRIAPSPTGMVHIGTLRTALYDYFLAKQTGGQFIVRIEDTDQKRSVESGIQNIVQTFHDYGIVPDEGFVLQGGEVKERGEVGPYLQSERLDIYREHLQTLLDAGNAYPCFCTAERLEEVRERQRAAKEQPKYDRHCLTLNPDEVKAKIDSGEPHVVRLKVPEGESSFNDAIRGTISFNHSEVDDQVLMKSDGFPTYHLAVVVDDHLMGITTMMRGEEWISSTPKQLLLYKMFGWDAPTFAHVPLLLNPDKTKLSKRQGDVSAASYLDRGYLPEAMLNFLATLGFNPTADRELYSMDELIELFNLSKVKSAGAVVNPEKLDWMNKQYLSAMETSELLKRLEKFTQNPPENFEKIVDVEKHRATVLPDIVAAASDYAQIEDYDSELLVWIKSDRETAKARLEAVLEWVSNYSGELTIEALEDAMKAWISKNKWNNGEVLYPTRVALSGKTPSSSPFEYMYILGLEEARGRIETAIEKLS